MFKIGKYIKFNFGEEEERAAKLSLPKMSNSKCGRMCGWIFAIAIYC